MLLFCPKAPKSCMIGSPQHCLQFYTAYYFIHLTDLVTVCVPSGIYFLASTLFWQLTHCCITAVSLGSQLRLDWNLEHFPTVNPHSWLCLLVDYWASDLHHLSPKPQPTTLPRLLHTTCTCTYMYIRLSLEVSCLLLFFSLLMDKSGLFLRKRDCCSSNF